MIITKKRSASLLLAAIILLVSVFTPVFAFATGETSVTEDSSADMFEQYVGSDGTVKFSSEASGSETLGSVLGKIRTIGTWVSGVATVVSMVFLIIRITQLNAASDNEGERRKATKGIVWSIVAIVLLGGITVVFGFFWNFLTVVG